MDRNQQDQIAKFICYAIGCLIAYYVLMALLPYVIAFFAILGVGYLYNECQKNNRRRH
jgi:uncharacterized BrkB/YihY/UPF0761 family membrane protein